MLLLLRWTKELTAYHQAHLFQPRQEPRWQLRHTSRPALHLALTWKAAHILDLPLQHTIIWSKREDKTKVSSQQYERGEKVQIMHNNPCFQLRRYTDYDIEQHQEKQTNEDRRKKVLSYLCCICCPCLPMWSRCICCFLLIVIVVLAVVAGILVALFQMPTVTFNGPTDDPTGLPRFQRLSGNESLGAFNINLGLNFTVINPNVEGLTFEKIKATVSV